MTRRTPPNPFGVVFTPEGSLVMTNPPPAYALITTADALYTAAHLVLRADPTLVEFSEVLERVKERG